MGPDIKDSIIAARERVRRALSSVGPDLAGVLIDVCCYLKGLEASEKASDGTIARAGGSNWLNLETGREKFAMMPRVHVSRETSAYFSQALLIAGSAHIKTSISQLENHNGRPKLQEERGQFG